MASPAMILGWKQEGRAEGFAEGLASGMIEARREDLLKLLRVKFVTIPPELSAAVRSENTLDPLTYWFDAALAAPTLEAFAVMIRSGVR
ncbi:hypothetical protein VT84_34275 [Gemmata sp. SH-PL17]|uniref:hypothetical protein n=1 Tax=Gemmata sp. SH-PL17 TaxID=1630693 RepID=UPI0004B238E4|nr:hypothetical protein [Gemmata sp. SH-PL17]AMV29512.1 hypothetical protein VT84_34275 [Gemmata sp. SH-PL17]